MKHSKSVLGILALSAAIIFLHACSATKITPEKMQALDSVINSNRWRFSANNVMPQFGNSGPVNGSYDVVCKNDSLVVYLPYFGRTNSAANAYNNKGPLDFTSTDFTLKKEQTKKGRWEISIQPKDNRDVQSINFILYTNGSAALSITMSSRSPISFDGRVEAIQ